MSTTENLYEGCEPIAVLRKRFLSLADGNHCAAFILDLFVAEIATREERAWYYAKYENKPLSYNVEMSIKGVTGSLFGLFTNEQVISALNLLIEKHYIGNNGRVEGTKDTYVFPVNRVKINHDSEVYRGTQKSTPDIPEDDPLLYAPTGVPNIAEPPLFQVQQASQEGAQPQRRSESKRVDYHNNRAARVGLPATLTIQQWTQTLEYFDWKCAICLDGQYEVLEHFIPIIHGGGTTEYHNCIPSCTKCNRIKHETHPAMIPVSSGISEGLERVRAYLETRRSEAE